MESFSIHLYSLQTIRAKHGRESNFLVVSQYQITSQSQWLSWAASWMAQLYVNYLFCLYVVSFSPSLSFFVF